MESIEAQQRARAERDAMIRAWQRKSDATYRPAPRRGLLRRAVHLLRSYPGNLAQDIAGVFLIFFLTWVMLVVTGVH